MRTASILITAASALCFSNFFYQLCTARAWDVAAERSFFQIVAILCCGLSLAAVKLLTQE